MSPATTRRTLSLLAFQHFRARPSQPLVRQFFGISDPEKSFMQISAITLLLIYYGAAAPGHVAFPRAKYYVFYHNATTGG